ncbi:hypothetical protein ASD8599_02573 [Ascidiaceihabitans donghaensis]|uniref:Uncharacterized protein n=1 Tax=Ascidiaceihabitans donghaensis TaxID=1510460 RepID=A0A2R8BFD8_9RHOB|nr:hypothetical protein [Ascidiaceihabitans donghaensis]SPH21824.1 hypothetical protein ASD8599_02573 [Ascidiaceihabitans donghaensis]
MSWFDTMVTLAPAVFGGLGGVFLVHKGMARTKWTILTCGGTSLAVLYWQALPDSFAMLSKGFAYSTLTEVALPAFIGLSVGVGFSERVLRARSL